MTQLGLSNKSTWLGLGDLVEFQDYGLCLPWLFTPWMQVAFLAMDIWVFVSVMLDYINLGVNSHTAYSTRGANSNVAYFHLGANAICLKDHLGSMLDTHLDKYVAVCTYSRFVPSARFLKVYGHGPNGAEQRSQ